MRTAALIKRIFQEMFRDKRTLALLFIAPLLILSLMYLLFNSDKVQPNLGVTGADHQLVKALEKADIHTVHYKRITNTEKTIKDDDLDAVLQYKDSQWKLTLQNDDPNAAKALQMKVHQTVSQFQSALMNNDKAARPMEDIKTGYIYGNRNTDFFDVLSPTLVGFFVFFFVFLISGIGLLKERTSGTLERLMSTPIRRWEIVTAYLVGFGTFAVIQTIIVVLYAINILDMVLAGSIWNVIIINLLLALVALSLGILLSSFAATEFQMVQFIPIAVVPQIFFSGIIPLDGLADWLQAVAKVMPLYYAADALKGIMYKGMELSDISWDLIALLIFASFFTILNVFALKKYRKL
ncbi:ABC transporter permease [Fictibacillus sp. NRS-1165]|uniref:ABC transporter permease n=1 Tax=Fictibacillus sp. NRS-1165 TaxID=3144463 RepID=UPI003D1A2D10